jgi:hydroxyacylglutathione hydrolase
LLARTSDEFVHLLTDNLPPRPEYFARDADLNRRGPTPLSRLPSLPALSAPEVLGLQQAGAIVLDTRPAMQFAVAHVPGSMHIALTGQFASWAARILGLCTPLIIVGEDPEHVRESEIRLARVGIENLAGYLADGVTGWIQNGLELDYIPQITVEDCVELRNQDATRIAVLDVRERAETEAGVIENAVCIPLGNLGSRLAELDREKLLVVQCKSGYRSSIATSILRRAGFRDVANLIGGFDAWRTTGLPHSTCAGAEA